MMNPLPLNARQQTQLGQLVQTGTLRHATTSGPTPDLHRASAFIDQALEALSKTANVTRPKVIYDMAYNVAHDVGEAVLAAYGYRTGTGQGQHAAVGKALGVVFDTPPGSAAATRFDNFRLTRNGIRYRAAPVSPADAREGLATATDLLAAAKAQLRHP